MSFISPIIDVLTQPQGVLMYHLLMLLIMIAALGMALVEWRRRRQRKVRHILIAFACLLLLRIILIGMQALWQSGIVASTTAFIMIPPLERLLTVVGTGLLCWAFLAPAPRTSWVPDALLVANAIAALLSYSVLVPLWYMDLQTYPGVYPYYTLHWQDRFWTVWQLGLLIMACVLFVLRKIEERELLLAAFGFLFLGNLLHLIAFYPQELPRLPVWARLGEMVAFPFLTVVVYRIVNKELRSASQELQTASVDSLRQTQELRLLIEASRTIGDSLDLDTILESVAQSMVLALDADQCAIILKDEAKDNKMQLAASYNALGGEESKVKVSFLSQEQPLIKKAIDRNSQLIPRDIRGNPEVKTLYTVLGSDQSGPLIIQPLNLHDEPLGVIIVANNRTKRAFSASQGSICQALAAQAAPAIKNGRRYQALSKEIGRLNRAVHRQQSEALHSKQLILGNIADGIVVSDENDKVVTVNSAAERILGVDNESLVGKDVRDILGGLSWQSATDTEQISSAIVVRESEGREIPPLQTVSTVGEKRIRADMIPVMLDDGNFWGIVTTLRDITEEAKAEQSKTHLIGNISEELRTPMTSIRSYTDILLAEVVGILGKAQREYMQKIQINVERVEQMLEELAEIITVDMRRAKIQTRPLDLERIIYEAVSDAREEMTLKEVELNFDLPDELPAVRGDPATVQQVLVNLLYNAFDLSPVGGNVDIKVTAEPGTEWEKQVSEQPRYLAISISDEGPSISAQTRQRILASTPEETSPSAPDSAEIDLRLTIAKSLIEAQGGRFWVESEGDAGNTFSFILPLAQEGKES
jgi:PAS domain S-box-containing protein